MNNPPAFPKPNSDVDVPEQEGMTLRDYFAAAALMGLARSYATGEVDDYLPQFVAQDAYKLADACLAEREKAQP